MSSSPSPFILPASCPHSFNPTFPLIFPNLIHNSQTKFPTPEPYPNFKLEYLHNCTSILGHSSNDRWDNLALSESQVLRRMDHLDLLEDLTPCSCSPGSHVCLTAPVKV